MPQFEVKYRSEKKPEVAFQILDQVMSQGEEMAKFDSSAKWKKNATQLSGAVEGKQFRAQVSVKPDGAGSLVVFTIEVGLLLMPLKGKIAEVLTRKLEKHIA